MALTTPQRELYNKLVLKWAQDAQAGGNSAPLVTLAFATNAQVKTQTLAYVNAAKGEVQAKIDGAAAARAIEDAALAQLIVDYDAIITELG